jgi:hypothetical protein
MFMAAVALRRLHEAVRLTTIPYVNRGFNATAVTQNSPLVHNPG